MQPMTFSEFSRISFQTITLDNEIGKNYPSGFLAIINGARDKSLFLRFEEEGNVAFAQMPNLPLGRSITIFNDPRTVKADSISDKNLEKLHIQIGEISSLKIIDEAYSKNHEALVKVILAKDKVMVECLIPNVSETLSLSSRKVIVLTNLKRECRYDDTAFILCGKNADGFWEPFNLTDDSIAVGTRAKFY